MTLKTDIDQIAVDAGKLHDIVHGGPTAVVATDGGSVKSVAKAIADLEAQIVTEAGSYVDQCQDEVALATAQAQTATNQAAAAAGSALSAASVVAQDLSAIDRTVFASIALVDAFLYDTSKDSDGGAWRHRCGHTSWENETLSGNWLGSAANEAAARAISGATTGSLYYDTTAAGFYTLNAGSGKTATYRGNVRQFPAQVLITVEAARVILWDLTQVNTPMWMVFVGDNSASKILGGYGSNISLKPCAAVNGAMCTGSNVLYDFFCEVVFPSDLAKRRRSLPSSNGSEGYWRHGIAARNSASLTFSRTGTVGYDLGAIVSENVNAVAMTVLPNAPVDVATGLPVPTIAVATNGGVSVIKDDGSVWDIVPDGDAAYSYAVSFTPDGRVMFENDAAGARRTVRVDAIPTADVAHVYTTKNTSLEGYTNGGTFVGDLTYLGGATSLKAIPKAIGTEAGLNVLRRNPGAPASGMLAYVTKDYNSGWQVGAIKGAWLADTVAETLTGAELVTNGDFTTDTTGWTADNATFVAAAGVATLTNSGSANGYGREIMTTVAGKTYTVSFDFTLGTAPNPRLIVSSTLHGGELAVKQLLASGKYSLTFVASGTAAYIECVTNSATPGHTAIFDNISCRPADIDRSVKGKGLQAFGSLTKAAVASGAALMGYSGFSAANYLEQPYNSDLDFGTGDFCIMGWLTEAPNSAVEYLFNRDSATPGKAIRLWVSVAGYLVFELYDGTTTRTATGTVAVDTSTRLFWMATYSAGTLTISVNGVSYATATGAALLTLTNASAVTRIGLDIAGSYPATNANLALVRAGATVPSAEQIKHIYSTEKALFEAGAQCCLAGTSNAVTALAYDEETDLLHVGTSYGRSAFKGLVRVASEATPVGAIVALAAGAGVIAQAGASGADVYVPAYSLREELLRDAEQMAKFGQNLIAHDFTATASQTNFALPVGWEIVAVYQQGALKRETTSWTRSFDGFVWSAVLGTGATVSDWISILAKRV